MQSHRIAIDVKLYNFMVKYLYLILSYYKVRNRRLFSTILFYPFPIFFFNWKLLKINKKIYTPHTHTHTHTYICVCIKSMKLFLNVYE